MNTNAHNTPRFLGLILVIALFTGATLHADCINGPKRPRKGWTDWEVIYHRNGVDVDVRYLSQTGFAGTGREKTFVQFRYRNFFPSGSRFELSNVHGVKIDGSAFFWKHESYPMTPFSLPDESGYVAGNSMVEGRIHKIDGRICKYTLDFRAY